MNIKGLYNIADINDISVYHFPMKETFAVSVPGNIGIDTNKIETSAEEKVILAHELGHCMKNAFYNIRNICDLREKHEYKADKWAVNTVIPFENLMQAVNNGNIAIVLINGGQASCKKVKFEDNGLMLISFNPAYEPMFFTKEECQTKPVQILGKVVELRGKF